MPSLDLFIISTRSSEPIYRQLIQVIRRRLAAGQLRAGEELPSVRQLAQSLAINPMTVSKAYGVLEAEGLLERRRGLPMVVSEAQASRRPDVDRVELVRPTLQRAAQEAHQLELPRDQVLALFKSMLFDGSHL